MIRDTLYVLGVIVSAALMGTGLAALWGLA